MDSLMPKTIEVKYSLTETAQFQRLVDFVQEVEQHGDESDDYTLKSIVDGLRDDLAEMTFGA